MVVVFTNCVDGPAGDLCTGLVRLIDRLARLGHADDDAADRVDPRCFAGRYVNLWGSADLACFDDGLLQVHLDSSDPTESLGELEVADATHLRYVRGRDGYASEGEPFTVDFDQAGRPLRLHGESSMSSWPPDVYAREFLALGRVRPGW